MQVDPVKPKLKPPGSKRLKLKCDVLLSNAAFKFNLRRYAKAYSMFFSLIFRHSSCQVRPSITHVSMGQVA